MDEFSITITVRTGMFEPPHSITIPIDELMLRRLKEPVELSNDTFTLMYEAVGQRCPVEKVIKRRENKFVMRKDIAKIISELITVELVAYFGDGDTIDGYRKN